MKARFPVAADVRRRSVSVVSEIRLPTNGRDDVEVVPTSSFGAMLLPVRVLSLLTLAATVEK
jgi:hypothetical protein